MRVGGIMTHTHAHKNKCIHIYILILLKPGIESTSFPPSKEIKIIIAHPQAHMIRILLIVNRILRIVSGRFKQMTN